MHVFSITWLKQSANRDIDVMVLATVDPVTGAREARTDNQAQLACGDGMMRHGLDDVTRMAVWWSTDLPTVNYQQPGCKKWAVYLWTFRSAEDLGDEDRVFWAEVANVDDLLNVEMDDYAQLESWSYNDLMENEFVGMEPGDVHVALWNAMKGYFDRDGRSCFVAFV